YRARAKASHPDSGGSAEAMARVNVAYHTLGDPSRRLDYDMRTAASQAHVHHHTAEPTSGVSPSTTEPAHIINPRGVHSEIEYINRQRTNWARASAWEQARLSGPVAIVVIIVTRFISGHTASAASRQAAGLFAFVP